MKAGSDIRSSPLQSPMAKSIPYLPQIGSKQLASIESAKLIDSRWSYSKDQYEEIVKKPGLKEHTIKLNREIQHQHRVRIYGDIRKATQTDKSDYLERNVITSSLKDAQKRAQRKKLSKQMNQISGTFELD